ncbi:MAG TPA: hypothetical protein VKZ97_05040 [Flavobacteriaceae bacterium]|nr:hypothetical protein [Flavobacteriaceae bacterium]
MKDEILVGKFKFWVNSNIIHCRTLEDFDAIDFDKNIQQAFLETITSLSQDRYMPLMIDVQNLSFSNVFKTFRFFVGNSEINRVILSKTFLVNSLLLNTILTGYTFLKEPFFPITIFNNPKRALTNCTKINKVFNAIG